MAEGLTDKGKWLTPLLAGLLVVLALVAWNHYSESVIVSSAPDERDLKHVYFGPLKSVAILPFDVESVDPGKDFWSTGFSIELARLLTGAIRLQVISPNSALFFTGQAEQPRVIAERLQVTYLLFGSFRFTPEGSQLSLRLFNARRNEDAWSVVHELENFSLFHLQDELVDEVSAALRIREPNRPPPVELVDPEAWTAYIRGLFHQQLRTAQGHREAEKAFQEALTLDLSYSEARLALASVWLARAASGENTPALVEDARAAIASVLQSEPQRPRANALASYIRRNHDWDWSGALDAAEKAVKKDPGDSEIMNIASLAMFSVGQFSRAGPLMEESVRRDPLNLAVRLRYGLLMEFSGDYDAALASYRQVLDMNPDFPGARAFRSRIKLIQQKPDSAMKESELESNDFWKRYAQILALLSQEKKDEANRLLDQMIIEDGQHAAYQIAEIFAFQGDLTAAFDWLERAYQQRDGGMKEMIGNYFLSNLHEDPRWAELLTRMKLPLDLGY